MSIEEECEGDFEHVKGFRGALGLSVEARQHVPDRRIGRFYQVGLNLGFGVRVGNPMTLERQGVAGVGIGKDGANPAHRLLGQSIGHNGTIHALVADMMGDNPALAATIDRPNYCPLPFF
jgi:hypothetical protein